MKHKTLVIFLAILGFLTLAEISLFLFFYLRAPKITDQIEPGSHALHVALKTGVDHTQWPMNSHIPLAIKVESNHPIQSVELYINNTLFESVSLSPETSSNTYVETWHWQPGTTGQFILIAHATDTSGFTGISQPVVLEAMEAVSSLSPVESSSGQTLAELAQTFVIPLEDLQAANPGITDTGSVIPEDEPVFIPNPPEPVTNPHIIPGYTLPEPDLALPPEFGVETGQLIELDFPSIEPIPEGGETDPPPISQKDNFSFWLKNLLAKPKTDLSGVTPPPGSDTPTDTADDNAPGNASYPPNPPTTFADFAGCDVKIRFNAINYTDPSDPSFIGANEDGFFLYRSRDGKPFERIAAWPKIVTYADAKNYENGFVDAKQYGTLTYYTAAFDEESEVPGNPVIIPLDPVNCRKPSRGLGTNSEVELDKDGNLVLPFSMDLAYFYIQRVVDNARTQAWRVPEGNRNFLPDSGVKFNLYTYLDTIPELRQEADLVLELHLWGWSGGELVHAGDFLISLHRSILLVCSVEGAGGCTGGGGGEWLPEIILSNTKPVSEQAYEVMWKTTNLSPVKDLCYQLAAGPWGEAFWDSGYPISSGCMSVKKGDYGGVFLYEIGKILYRPGESKFAGPWGKYMDPWYYDSNWFTYDIAPGMPFTLYMRAYPRHELTGLNRFANTAVMHYNTAPLPSELPPLASNLSSIFDVEILENTYVPPNFEVMADWGCVIVEEDPTGTYQPGQKVCPPLMSEHTDDCEGKNEVHCLADAMYDQAMDAYDQMLWVWDLWKTEVAKWLSATLGPWCYNSQECRDLNKKALEYIIQYYTGIPANPPASDELIADSAAEWIVSSAVELEKYYTGQDVSAIEALCEIEKCEEKIKEKLKEELKSQRSQASQPACINSYQAYFNGKKAMCLDPSIIVHPAAGGGNYPAMVGVRITRKVDIASQGVKESDIGQYLLDISVNTENQYNNDAINGPIYYQTRLKFPWIEPGESFVMTTNLMPCAYDLNLPGCTGGINYYGFEALYFGGTSHMKAVEMCYSTGSSWEWVPCTNGGSDSWDFINPPDKATLEVGQP